MNTEGKTAAITQISYREYLIAQIASGIVANDAMKAKLYISCDELAEIVIRFADATLKRLSEEDTFSS